MIPHSVLALVVVSESLPGSSLQSHSAAETGTEGISHLSVYIKHTAADVSIGFNSLRPITFLSIYILYLLYVNFTVIDYTSVI